MGDRTDSAAKQSAPAGGVPGLGAALLLLLAGAFLRCPAILIHGRMWGEELPVFLLSNWNRSFLFALEAQHFGYFSIWDNFLAGVAVHWVPLTAVALLFTWSGVVMLLLTGYLVYQAEFLAMRPAKTVAVAALLLTAPSMETWINLLNSEFFFGIWAAVILLSDAERLRVQRFAALFVAVLSGPLTTLLAPLFVLRAVLERNRSRYWQAGIVCVGGLAQLAVARSSSISGREVHPNPFSVIPVLFDKELIELFLSRIGAKANLLLMRDHLHFGTLAWILSGVGLAFCATGLFLVVRRQRVALLLLGVALWMAVLEAMLGLGGGWSLLESGERYSFLPNYVIQLALIVVAFSVKRESWRTASRILLGMSLASGAVDYVLLPIRFKDAWTGDPWRQQVMRWERDPSAPLQTHPLSSWPAYHLPPRQ